VIEFDSVSVLREWDIPANDSPLGLRGDALLVALVWFDDSIVIDSMQVPVLAVLSDGRIRVERLGGSLPPARSIDCPPHAREANSDFWSCFAYIDMRSGKTRRLGYNGVCT
jgi:hypothetical protein